MYHVKKRNGEVADFDIEKIRSAITKTFESCNRNYQDSIIESIVVRSVANAEKKIKDSLLSVEDIQDSVEATLMNFGYDDVAKSYILYRKQHEKARNAKNTLLDYKKTIEGYVDAIDWRVKENASIDYSLGGLILGNSGAVTANYWLSEIYDDEIANAHRNCDIHLHDLSMLSGYCFTGDTKVAVIKKEYESKYIDDPYIQNADGRINYREFVSFEELIKSNRKNPYIIAHTGNVDDDQFEVIQAEDIRITRYVDTVIEITFKTLCYGDVKIKSTLDHPYMVFIENSDGDCAYDFVKASELKIGDYVNSLEFDLGGGYVDCGQQVKDINIIKLDKEIPVYDLTVPKYHNFVIEGDIFVHNCAGWSLKTLIKEGFGGVPKKISSAPAKHLSTICNQMINFLGTMSLEWAGAQAFNSVDTLLAPFIKVDDMPYSEVKQCMQSLVFGLNVSSRWGSQPVFSNFTFDWTVPDDLAELNCIVGGKEVDFKYKDCQREMDMINKAFLETMIAGDSEGRSFAYPIPTYSITRDFDWSDDSTNNKLLFELTAKYGVPYFSNYLNSDMSPSDTRSMCPMHKDTQVIIKVTGKSIRDSIENVYDEYSGNIVDVLTPNGWRVGKPILVKNQRTYEFVLSNGLSVCLGENHLQPTKDNGTLLAKDLKIGMLLPYVYESDIVIAMSGNCKSDIQYSEISSIREIKYSDSLYCFEVDTDDHLFILGNGIVTHNCRLRLDLRELRRKNGGFFGSGDNTGSIQVCTINMPRLAYTSSTKEEFYSKLEHLMDVCARAMDIKRHVLTQHLENGLYPYTKRYLGSFDDHFSTIGIVGMNECCLNASWIADNIASEVGREFTINVLDFMRNKLADYQEQYGCLFNLEATPAESTTHRFAIHDKEKYPDIITAGDSTNGAPYYTNSSHLPVGYTDDIFEALDHQDDLQTKYTSGTVFHAFLGEKLPDWKSAMKLTRKIAENYKLPYFTFSPTYSICPDHGYITGEHWECPTCGKPTEVYSRVTGYYRAVQNFNDGKAHEFRDRKEYVINSSAFSDPVDESTDFECKECSVPSVEDQKQDTVVSTTKPILFTTATCPNCKMAKRFIEEAGFDCDIVLADENADLARQYGVSQAPTLIVFNDGEPETIKNVSNIRKYLESLK